MSSTTPEPPEHEPGYRRNLPSDAEPTPNLDKVGRDAAGHDAAGHNGAEGDAAQPIFVEPTFAERPLTDSSHDDAGESAPEPAADVAGESDADVTPRYRRGIATDGTDAASADTEMGTDADTDEATAEPVAASSVTERHTADSPDTDADTGTGTGTGTGTVSESHAAPGTAENASADSSTPTTAVFDAQRAPADGAGAEPTTAEPTAQYAAAMYVTAPEPPKRKGNRGAGILIALLATVAYAIISAIVVLVTFFITKRTPDVGLQDFVQYLGTASYFVPIVFFFLAFILLIAIVNRGGWWAYVLGAFFVGVIVYFAYIGGVLLTIQAWNFSAAEVGRILGQLWANPLTIGAAIVAREVPIWFGAWISRRGKKVRERNDEAQREHERRLAAGPQPLQRSE